MNPFFHLKDEIQTHELGLLGFMEIIGMEGGDTIPNTIAYSIKAITELWIDELDRIIERNIKILSRESESRDV